MAAQTILFVGDKFHFSQTAASVYSVSSTQNGYNKEAVRDTNWLWAWKPSDGTSDEHLQVDGGSAGWLGTTGGATIHCAIAYDARGCDQTLIKVNQDAADNPAGTFSTIKGTFTVNTTAPTVDYLTFLLTTSGKQYYRLAQFNADRGGGSKTIKIYGLAFFTASEVYNIDTGYPQSPPGAGAYDFMANVGVATSAGGMDWTNVNGTPYQEAEVNIQRATATLWQALRSQFMSWHQGNARNFWLQYDGIQNAAKDSFGMVSLTQPGYGSRRVLRDLYDTRLRIRTVAKPL
jgi:hypothetical protein